MHSLSRKNPFFWPVALSLATHLLLLLGSRNFFESKSIANLSTRPSTVLQKPFRVRVLQDPPNLTNGTVVDIEDNAPSEKTATNDAKYLGLKNRTVEKETQARNTGLNPQASAGQQSQTKKGSSSPSKNGSGFNLNLSERYLDEFQNQQQETASRGGQSPSNYLPGVDYGIDTQLNTREYKYASFFIRMKRQLESVWSPMDIARSRRLDPRNYITTVSIVLNSQGYLDKVDLVESCGNMLLDQEAIRAVKQAGPYLNPPTGMVERNGKIVIDQFKFIVTLGGGIF